MLTTLKHAAAIGAAGFVGAVVRYLVTAGSTWLFGPGFPVGTTIVNLSGSFLLGWFVTVATHRGPVPEVVRLAVATGFVGSYTTFSTWMVDSNKQLDDGETFKAALNLLGSLVLGLAAVKLGVWWADGRR